MALSSIQLARLVQAYVAEPGASLEEKATRVGVRRNELLRAARGTIARTTRLRLLAFFAHVRVSPRAHRKRKRGFTWAPRPTGRRPACCGTLAAAR